MTKEKPHLDIGTSGWHYEHWKKIFYPDKLSKSEWFQYYSKEFGTVEINNTFYHLPKEKTIKNWHKQSPRKFTFSVKISRYITHIKRLKEPKKSIKLFFKRIKYLEDNLGPILHQLPPTFKKDEKNVSRLSKYLKALPDEYRHVIEFRHPSWFDEDVYNLLSKHNAALCIVSMPDFPTVLKATSDFVYIRMHGGNVLYGSNYSKKELKECYSWIKRFLDDGLDVYVYFNNDARGYAIKNAKTLIELLS